MHNKALKELAMTADHILEDIRKGKIKTMALKRENSIRNAQIRTPGGKRHSHPWYDNVCYAKWRKALQYLHHGSQTLKA